MILIVNLTVKNNIVVLSKNESDSSNFVKTYLTKYENVTKVDPFNSTRKKKVLKSVKEIRFLYTEDENNIYFSRGILELVPNSDYIATYEGISNIKVPDLTLDEVKKTLDVFDLREDQAIAVTKGLVLKRGVIQLPTATGKSAIITSINKRLLEVNPNMHSLVIAPTLSTVKNIHNTFQENGLESSVYGHPDKSINSKITVALPQSLVTSGDENLLKDIDAVFYDECLPGNSKILLPDGSFKSISEIYKNDNIDSVLSYNVSNNQYESKRILRKFKTPYNDRFCKVYYRDAVSGKLKGVTCTSNHKIYTKNRGYVQASELTTEDYIKVDYEFARNWIILNPKTYIKVERVTYNVGKVAEFKYNLEVEGNHNYFANNVLVSNCHHLKCDTWNKLNSMLSNVEYSLGFSALSIDKKEIYIDNFRDLSYESSLIVGSSGRVLMHMDPSYYIEKGIIALPVILRIENYEPLPQDFDESNWSKLVKTGLMSTARTNKVARAASVFAKSGRKVLILVSEKNYAFRVCDFLVKYDMTDFGISFGGGVGYTFKGFKPPKPGIEEDELEVEYNCENSMDVVDKLNNGEISVLLATTHLDEGVDINCLDACVLACGGKKDRRIIQRVGRVLRKSKNGKYAYIIDFTDSASRVLGRQSKSRLNMYKKDIGVPVSNIYDKLNIEDLSDKFYELEGLNSPS